MSVVINSNHAATSAANNLAVSNGNLQRSLNRLSSGSKIVNPSDDAGGLAVSMKLSAAARRQGAVATNIANEVSLLQTQDGVLSATGKILNRISELKVLHSDITKSSSDRANYQAEFAALQAQIIANGGEKFNGVSLFGSSSQNVITTEDGTGSVTTQGVELLGAPTFPTFSDTFPNLSNWTDTSFAGGSASASGTLNLQSGGAGFGTVESNQSFSGSFGITLNFQRAGGVGNFNVQFGGEQLFGYNFDTNPHTLQIEFDGAGNAVSYLDGSTTAYSTQTGIVATSGNITLESMGSNADTQVDDFSIQSLFVVGDTAVVAYADDLDTLSLSEISTAIEDVATYRAENGANQSRFGFATELLTVNKANLEAANSRITDVDVAQESTSLARYNILVQAGTSMLAQANQAAQSVLKLIS